MSSLKSVGFSSLQELNALQEKAKSLKLKLRNSVEKDGKKVDDIIVTYLGALMNESEWGKALAKMHASSVAMKEGYSFYSIDLMEKFYDVSDSIHSHPITVQKRKESKKAKEEIEQRRKTNQMERQEKQSEEDCGNLKTALKVTAISIIALSVLQMMIAIFLGKPDGKM